MFSPSKLDSRLAGVFVLALGVRLLYLLESSAAPTFFEPVLDAASYDRLARRLAGGGGLTGQDFWQPLFYPAFLAGVYRLSGSSIVAAKLIQAVVGALTCVLTARLGDALFDRRTGTLAGVLAALCGPLVFFEAELLATGWAAFWSVALVLLVAAALRRTRPALDFVWGLASAAAVLTRPTFLFATIAATAWLAATRLRGGATKRTVSAGLGLAATGFCCLAVPAALLAQRHSERLSFLPASGGINLYIGNNDAMSQTVGIRPGWEWQALTRSPAQSGVRARKDTPAFFLGRVAQYATAKPGSFLGGLARKTAEFFSSRELPRNVDLYTYRETSWTLSLLVWRLGRFGFPFGVLLPLAALGFTLHRRLWRSPLPYVLLAYALSVILVFVSSRYRTPVLPLLIVPAAAGALAVADGARSGRLRAGWLPAAVAAVLLLVSVVPGPFAQEATDYRAEMLYLLGVQASQRGDTDRAVEQLDHALLRQPRHTDALTAMGVVLDRLGRRAEAIERYRAAIAAEPRNAIAHANLARLRYAEGSYAEAAAGFERALDLDPFNARIQDECGVALVRLGRLNAAIDRFGKALEINSARAVYHFHLGTALGRAGHRERAAAALETAARLAVQDGDAALADRARRQRAAIGVP